MTLSAGVKLGVYEISGLLGKGGMGEVYRARDTRLGREVAVKALPDALASDPERIARFQREAQVLASLSHPNIAVIHELEEVGAARYLILELVEGETLADRMALGPLPVDESLDIARQIAHALEAAHEKGVIHRDLKPANVKITPDGRVKVLDFGLAKLVTDRSGWKDGPSGEGFSNSPTLSVQQTLGGVILGTAGYMSPEQARGKPVDRRADVWAFGCVLYEMLTGRRTFAQGETITDTLAKILERDPDWHALPAGTPPSIRTLLERCLRKDPSRRLRDIGDARLEIEEAGSDAGATPAPAPASSVRRDLRPWLALATLAAVLLAASVFARVYFRTPAPAAPRVQFEIPAVANPAGNPAYLAVSPDGRQLAYVAPATNGQVAIWVRPLDSLDVRMLPGTEGAGPTDWSPDGRFLVFSANGKLKKVDVAGGRPQTLADLPANYRRAAWNRDGVIIFGSGPVLYRVSASGGETTRITQIDTSLGETFHATPSFLPDGRHFLYNALSTQPENRAIYIASLDSTPRTRLMRSESKVMYSPPGFIVFMRERTLMARPFDASRLAFTGDPVPIAEQVAYNEASGAAAFHVSGEGTLAYRRGGSEGSVANRRWLWMDRTGKSSAPVGAPHNSTYLTLSPDAKRVAFFEASSAGGADVGIYDLERDLKIRLTTDPGPDTYPVWSPDGARIVFASQRGTNAGVAAAIYEKPSSGAVPERLFYQPEPGVTVLPRDWSADGRLVVIEKSLAGGSAAGRDIWVLPVLGDRKPTPYLASAFDEGLPVLSPNGRWLAYVTNESGTYQVVVQPFPDPTSGKWQISTKGGLFPRWRRDGCGLVTVYRLPSTVYLFS